VRGDAQDVHAAALDLHHEEHMQTCEEHGADVQEVARQNPRCLGGQELPPGRRRRDPHGFIEIQAGRIDTLAPQELKIARMVAGGLNNSEAAAAMFLSRKTVETHLTRVYRKLEIRFPD
jgi:DNA-binding NarL/FixJ family response regulator